MVAQQSFNLEGIYIVDERPELLEETVDEDGDDHTVAVQGVFESSSSSITLSEEEGHNERIPHDDSYNFDDCYSDDSSCSSSEDDLDGIYNLNNDSVSVSLQRMFNRAMDSFDTYDELVDLEEFEDNDSIFTFNSFKNASSRGIRRWHSSSGKALFSNHSITSLSVDSIDELGWEDDDDDKEFSESLIELTVKLRS